MVALNGRGGTDPGVDFHDRQFIDSCSRVISTILGELFVKIAGSYYVVGGNSDNSNEAIRRRRTSVSASAGFNYPDLYKPERLKELVDIFDCEVAAANPELFARWDDYRRNPEKPRAPQEISALLVAVAGHVSQFVTRLFGIESEVDTLAAATADQNPIFRFKVDFVRRRVIPALKKISAPQIRQSWRPHVRKLLRRPRRKRDESSIPKWPPPSPLLI